MIKPRVMSPGFCFSGDMDTDSFSTQRKAEGIREKQRKNDTQELKNRGTEGQRKSAGVLECWSVGVLECWSAGVLGCWSDGVLECWSAEVME